jgi:hypothetical protein
MNSICLSETYRGRSVFVDKSPEQKNNMVMMAYTPIKETRAYFGFRWAMIQANKAGTNVIKTKPLSKRISKRKTVMIRNLFHENF